MSSFQIEGGHPLKGELRAQGAKNEALQIISACLLTDQEVILEKVPDILDVNRLLELIADMGVEVNKIGDGKFSIKAKEVNADYLNTEEFRQKSGRLRGSVMLAGPMLARYHHAFIPQPGGDRIGRRRLDTHINAFADLGVKTAYDKKQHMFTLEHNGPINFEGTIFLEEPSVTGTANIIMASVLNQKKAKIYNAACEPYIQKLCQMLNEMGAKISGIGSNLLEIEGVESLGGTTHVMNADMIEIGSFIGLAAATQSDILIKDAGVELLGNIPETFRRLGIEVIVQGDDLHVPAQKEYKIQKFMDGSILTVYDNPWPGFTPDLLSIIIISAVYAKGTVLVHQKMFESRLFFVDRLIEMGAQIVLCDPHRAVVIGNNRQNKLQGITMVSPDIRAGVTMLIAALSAEGTSVIQNIDQIDRGYERIDERLNAIGAKIKRI